MYSGEEGIRGRACLILGSGVRGPRSDVRGRMSDVGVDSRSEAGDCVLMVRGRRGTSGIAPSAAPRVHARPTRVWRREIGLWFRASDLSGNANPGGLRSACGSPRSEVRGRTSDVGVDSRSEAGDCVLMIRGRRGISGIAPSAAPRVRARPTRVGRREIGL